MVKHLFTTVLIVNGYLVLLVQQLLVLQTKFNIMMVLVVLLLVLI